MTKRLRIAVLAPQGWCLRDWVFSDFIPTLTPAADVTVFTPQADALRKVTTIDDVRFEFMAAPRFSRWPALVWRALHFGHHYRHPTNIHRWNLRYQTSSSFKARCYGAVLRAMGRCIVQFLPYGAIEWIERNLLGMQVESRRMEQALRDGQFDLVLATTPLTSHFERPALWAAQRLGIRTVGFITSWDNIYGKGNLPIAFSHYLVWGQAMRHDLLVLYPHIDPETVTEVGVPRFDFYRRPEMLRGRDEFIRSIGGDPARPVLLWSAVSPALMPEEPQLLARFCDAVRAGKVAGHPQVLLRPHPIGGGRYFAAFRLAYPEVLFTETNDEDAQFLVGWMPLLDDMELLVNSIAHAAVNVNLCSTFTLDCFALDLPVVNIGFSLQPGFERGAYVTAFYTHEHYRPVVEQRAARLASNMDEFIDHVNAYLQDRTLDRGARTKVLRLWCGEVDGRSAERAARCLIGQCVATVNEPLAIHD